MASFTTLFGRRTAYKVVPTPFRTSKSSTARYHGLRIQWAAALCLAVFFSSHTLAFPLLDELDELPEPTAAPDLAEVLLLDTKVPAFLDGGRWTMLEPEENELRRRASAAGPVTTTFAITVPMSTSTATGIASDSDDSGSKSSSPSKTSASATSSTATATSSQSSLPSPFDGGLSNNFTSTSCPTFINNMLADAEFQACYPVSLLLQVRMDPRICSTKG